MLIIGIDEAGRGSWAGPICASAVALSPKEILPPNTKDSKKLSETARENVAKTLKLTVRYAIASLPSTFIDQNGLSQANQLVLEIAYFQLLETYPELQKTPHQVIIDGNRYAKIKIPNAKFQTKGESHHREVAAASILAKTHRDQQLHQLDKQFPQYGFSKHKGYGTKLHQEALKTHGPIPGVHRMSYQPIKLFINSSIQIVTQQNHQIQTLKTESLIPEANFRGSD